MQETHRYSMDYDHSTPEHTEAFEEKDSIHSQAFLGHVHEEETQEILSMIFFIHLPLFFFISMSSSSTPIAYKLIVAGIDDKTEEKDIQAALGAGVQNCRIVRPVRTHGMMDMVSLPYAIVTFKDSTSYETWLQSRTLAVGTQSWTFTSYAGISTSPTGRQTRPTSYATYSHVSASPGLVKVKPASK